MHLSHNVLVNCIREIILLLIVHLHCFNNIMGMQAPASAPQVWWTAEPPPPPDSTANAGELAHLVRQELARDTKQTPPSPSHGPTWNAKHQKDLKSKLPPKSSPTPKSTDDGMYKPDPSATGEWTSDDNGQYTPEDPQQWLPADQQEWTSPPASSPTVWWTPEAPDNSQDVDAWVASPPPTPCPRPRLARATARSEAA